MSLAHKRSLIVDRYWRHIWHFRTDDTFWTQHPTTGKIKEWGKVE